jgi:phosphate transport system protein
MEMAGLAEDQVARAVHAFLVRDTSAAKVIRKDDRRIDGLEMNVDEQIVQLLALYQPVASDLRQVLSSLKVSHDMERVGDHAFNIAKAARRLGKNPPLEEIPEMAELAVHSERMLRDALAAFGSRDPALARDVCARDDRVDELKKTVHGIIVSLMQEKPGTVPSGQEYIRVAQQLERIGDLSTNISEEVVFMVEGRSIKHGAEASPGEA